MLVHNAVFIHSQYTNCYISSWYIDYDLDDEVNTISFVLDTCIKDGQTKKEHEDKLKYIWVVGTLSYDMPCPAGTSFKFELCICDHDGRYTSDNTIHNVFYVEYLKYDSIFTNVIISPKSLIQFTY